MKEGLHPNYSHEAIVKCVCGNTFTTGSVKNELKVEVCAKCHPFFTGKNKILDKGGRIQRFMKKYNMEMENQDEE